MKIILLFLCSMASAFVSSGQSAPDCQCTHPFPYKATVSNELKTSNFKPLVEDQDVTESYIRWKRDYLKPDPHGDNLIIENRGKGEPKKYLTTSEAMSYGMIVEVLMAGYDPGAKSQFDRLYRYTLLHPSAKSKFLMAWSQRRKSLIRKKGDVDSAVDGDIDIAYALLLAYKQWRDEKYKLSVDSTLAAILAQEIDVKNNRIVRGNASVPADGFAYQVIRMSDFMPVELRSFYSYTGQSIWLDLLKRNYKRYEKAQAQFSRNFGMFPDYLYVSDNDSLALIPESMPKDTLEDEGFDDGGETSDDNPRGRFYGLNSCRVPWRIATDFLLNGDGDAKQIIATLNKGIRKYTLDDACLLANVMQIEDSTSPAEHKKKVEGSADKHSADLSTIGPLCVAAYAGGQKTPWRDRLLGLLLEHPASFCPNNNHPGKPNYYGSTIRMICLLLLSNHYWAPEI
jgi:hypothetical protein